MSRARKITELPIFDPGEQHIFAMAVEVNREYRRITIGDYVYDDREQIIDYVDKILSEGKKVFLMPYKE